jgi:hypothetical protein
VSLQNNKNPEKNWGFGQLLPLLLLILPILQVLDLVTDESDHIKAISVYYISRDMIHRANLRII